MATMVDLKCIVCEKDFTVKKGSEKMTCSKECKKKLRADKDEIFYIEKECPICHNIFRSKKKENKKYCSYTCNGKAKTINGHETRICRMCGKEFYDYKSKERTMCSDECRLKWIQIPENMEKRSKTTKETLLNKYGVDCTMKIKDVQNKSQETKIRKRENGEYDINKLLNGLHIAENNRREKLTKRFGEMGYEILEYNGKDILVKHPDGHIFECDRKHCISRLNSNTELSTKLLPISSPRSTLELIIVKFLADLNIESLTNNRSILHGDELDVVIQSANTAIEINGLYWHCEYYRDSKYHYNKLVNCRNVGYNLLNFFEDEIIEKLDIVKSIILNKINQCKTRIYGRNCIIKDVSYYDSEIFLGRNHIQGNCMSKFRYGLYYNDELVSLMTFGNLRNVLGSSGDKNEFELIRFCNKLNTNVIGGASKLLKHFIKNINPYKIISYANLRYSNGNLYEKLGFTFMGETKPNYFYVIKKKREHRYKYRKDLLIKEGFDSNKTEHEIMLERKIPRIYDCGCLKYEMILNK